MGQKPNQIWPNLIKKSLIKSDQIGSTGNGCITTGHITEWVGWVFDVEINVLTTNRYVTCQANTSYYIINRSIYIILFDYYQSTCFADACGKGRG